MRGLCTRRHVRILSRPWTGGAVADGEDVLVPCRLQRLLHDQLVRAVRLESVQVPEEVRGLHARRPHDQLRRNGLPARESDSVRQDLGDASRRAHPHTFALQQPAGGIRETLRQRWQDSFGRLDQVELDVRIRIDPVKAVRHQFPGCVVQLGGKLNAGCPGTDDGHLQLLWPKRLRLRVRAHEGVDQPTMKARCVARCLERDGVLLDARGTEIVGETADRDHQRVVRERAPRGDLFAILINDRRYLHLAPLPVEADHLSKTVAKVVPVRLSQIVELVYAQIHAAGGHLVQQRLPQVRPGLVDQLDPRLAAFANPVAELGG